MRILTLLKEGRRCRSDRRSRRTIRAVKGMTSGSYSADHADRFAWSCSRIEVRLDR